MRVSRRSSSSTMVAMLWVLGGCWEAGAPFEDFDAIDGGGRGLVVKLPSAKSVLKSEPMVTQSVVQCTTWEKEETGANKRVWMAADVLNGVGLGGEWAED